MSSYELDPKAVASFLIQRGFILATKGSKIRIDGSNMKAFDRAWQSIHQEIETLCRDEKQDWVSYFTLKDLTQWKKDFFDGCKEVFTEETLNRLKSSMVIDYTRDIALYIDLQTNEELLCNTESMLIVRGVSIEALKLLNKDEMEMLLEFPKPCFSTYNPARAETHWFESHDLNLPGGQDLKHIPVFNKHTQPAWVKIKPTDQDLPEDFERVINEFFLNKEDQIEYFFSHMHHALKDRSRIAHVFSGDKGVGKTKLIHALTSALFGADQIGFAPSNFFERNFNGDLAFNRAIMIDEFSANTERRVEAIKRLANDYQALEVKYKDAEVRARIYCTFFFAINPEAKMQITPEDRRFSVYDISTESLFNQTDEQTVLTVFKKLLNDVNYQSQIGHYIKNYVPSVGTEVPYKGKRYFEVCLEGLTGWQKLMVNHLADLDEGEEVSSMYLRREIKENLSHGQLKLFTLQKVQEFLDSYVVNGVDLGSAKSTEQKGSFVITKGTYKDQESLEEEVEQEDFDSFLDQL